MKEEERKERLPGRCAMQSFYCWCFETTWSTVIYLSRKGEEYAPKVFILKNLPKAKSIASCFY